MSSNITTKHILVYVLSLLALCLVGPISISVITIPLTLQTMVLCVIAYLYGWAGLLACISYILLGLIGLPIFSGFETKTDILQTVSAGFVLAFPIMVCTIIQLKKRAQHGIGPRILLFVFSHLVLIGTAFIINSILRYSFISAESILTFLLPSLLFKSIAAAIFVTFIPSKRIIKG